MRVPVSHPLLITAALCLTAAAHETSQVSIWADASVSEKLRIIRQSVSARETAFVNKGSVLAQNWRNCISGYWRNC
jgi:hypothetical protein